MAYLCFYLRIWGSVSNLGDFLSMLWLKAFHIIFMVTWFAGLFYLPRLYVYHAQTNDDISIERFKIMERKLFWGIMTPGAIITVVLGVALIMALGGVDYLMSAAWLQAKLILIAVLVIYHVWCGKLLINFKNNDNQHSHVWYRWFNEFPVFLITPIVILVVVKPF